MMAQHAACVTGDRGCVMFDCLTDLWEWIDPPLNTSPPTMESKKQPPATQQPHHHPPPDQRHQHPYPHHLLTNPTAYRTDLPTTPLLDSARELYGTRHDTFTPYPPAPDRNLHEVPKGYNAEVYQDYLKRNPPKETGQMYQNQHGCQPANQYAPYPPYTSRLPPAEGNTADLLRRQYNEIQQMKLRQQMKFQNEAQMQQQQIFAERQLLLQQIHGVQPPPNLQQSIYSEGYREPTYGQRDERFHLQSPTYQTSAQAKQVPSAPQSPPKSDSTPSVKSPTSSSESRRGSGPALRPPLLQRRPDAPVTMAGVLYKQGSDGLRVWRKRWFVLAEYCLFYYKSSEEEKVLGSVLLPSYTVSACGADERATRKFAFKLEHTNMRTYVLAAPDGDAMARWLKALTQAALMHDTRTEDEVKKPSREKSTEPVERPTSEDMDENAGPTYVNAPPKPRRSNDGYGSPGPDIYDPNYDLLQKPASQYSQGTNRLQDTSHKLPDTSHRLPDTSHRLPDTSHRLPDTSHTLPDMSHRLSDTSHRHPEYGHHTTDRYRHNYESQPPQYTHHHNSNSPQYTPHHPPYSPTNTDTRSYTDELHYDARRSYQKQQRDQHHQLDQHQQRDLHQQLGQHQHRDQHQQRDKNQNWDQNLQRDQHQNWDQNQQRDQHQNRDPNQQRDQHQNRDQNQQRDQHQNRDQNQQQEQCQKQDHESERLADQIYGRSHNQSLLYARDKGREPQLEPDNYKHGSYRAGIDKKAVTSEKMSIERRTPDAYGRSSAAAAGRDYEDVYPAHQDTHYGRSHSKLTSPPVHPHDYAVTHTAQIQQQSCGPSVLRRKKMQSQQTPPAPLIARPHSADFLEYEANHPPPPRPDPAHRQPQRPKSSLDINSFYDPSSDSFYSEESYAQKMRQSTQYLRANSVVRAQSANDSRGQLANEPQLLQVDNVPGSIANNDLRAPVDRDSRADDMRVANNDLRGQFANNDFRAPAVKNDSRAASNDLRAINNDVRVASCSRELAHKHSDSAYSNKYGVEQQSARYAELDNSNWTLKEKTERTSSSMSGGVGGEGAGEHFMRSASARLPSATSDSKDGERKREESMKRLLEWKQRMLQSPLTRKSTPASISLARSLNQSRPTSKEDPYKNNSYKNASYNSYSSDDEASVSISQSTQQVGTSCGKVGAGAAHGRRDNNIPVRAVSPRVRWNDSLPAQLSSSQLSLHGAEEPGPRLQPVRAVSPRVRQSTVSHPSDTQQIECLSSLSGCERAESLQRLEHLKLQLADLEHQYNKSKPLVHLVDNMVKLGSLYNRGGAANTLERLERNQRLRHQVLAEQAEEQRRWAAGEAGDVEAARARVEELCTLERELASEAAALHGLKADKEAIETLLTGVRGKFGSMPPQPSEPPESLEADLARVHAMLAHNSKKLEATVADNARLERELLALRRALHQHRHAPPPQHRHTPTTALLEDEVSRVQQLVSQLQQQRQELSRAVRRLTQQSHALQQAHPHNIYAQGGLKRRGYGGVWQETDLDSGACVEHGVDDADTELSGVLTTSSTMTGSSTLTGCSAPSLQPLYVDTRALHIPHQHDVTSPASDDASHGHFGNLGNVEKQEIKTVRIVKRESERRQRDRHNAPEPAWTAGVATSLDRLLEEELQPGYRAATSPYDCYKSRSQPPNYLRLSNVNVPGENMQMSPKYPSSPSLACDYYSRDSSYNPSIGSGYNRHASLRESYDQASSYGRESAYDRALSMSAQYLNSPRESGRTLTEAPLSKTSSVASLPRTAELSPVFKSEAARQIITEVSAPSEAATRRRVVPREKRRHNTAPHHLSANALADMTQHYFAQEKMGRSLDDADMALVLRAPDVVRSSLPATRIAAADIDSLFLAPRKILIPERYVPEQPPQLSPEEQRKRQEKVESIKKMLSSATSDPAQSPDGAERRQREHLLHMNQILANQVMEMSKIVAEKALSELPARGETTPEDSSPEAELPIYQQRDNFFT